MYAKYFIAAAALLLTVVSAVPTPGSVNVPISAEEMQRLKDAGLKARSSSINVPITDAEMSALESAGLAGRSVGLEARDKVMNCGHHVNGKGGSNGHGKWIPVNEFRKVADKFCGAYVGTDIYKGHETSDVYAISLTNQDDDSKPGDDGNIVLAIYNTERSETYVIDHKTCYDAMLAPLGDHVSHKRDGKEYVQLGKRDNCYGTKNHDYEGGYYKVDSIGAFGSEVYAAPN
ncbi:hypothetical protein GGS21DRAFT_129008 [Xylaria nigripes]|nr:hypothetical protein GGS21DRAFT_129008 [Xylaria nigripes]